MSAKYYVLILQPDDPITFRFATEDEYTRALTQAREMSEIVIDEKGSGPVYFSTADSAIAFMKAVWG